MYVPPPGIGQGKLQTAAYQVWSEGNPVWKHLRY